MLLLPSDNAFQNQLLKKFLQEHYQSVKRSGPDVGPSRLQSLLADDLIAASNERVKQ